MGGGEVVVTERFLWYSRASIATQIKMRAIPLVPDIDPALWELNEA